MRHAAPDPVRHVEHVMGTAVSIDLADPLDHATRTVLIRQVCDWLHEVDRRFSTYRPDSEVCRLDRGELTGEAASEDLRSVLDACAQLWRETDGFFDTYASGRFDPSGYVKGWSVEVASARLAAAGSVNHCVNAGGDLRCRGHRGPDRPWRLGVRHPWQAGALAWVLTGTDLAVATSGTYERGHHVLDPRTRTPARELCSVTVVGPDLGRADAYATAALAMGAAAPRWLARLSGSGFESAVVTAGGQAWCSPGWADAG